jgi:hypothetical protein
VTGWQPPWAKRDEAAVALVVASTTRGIEITFDAAPGSPGLCKWIATWASRFEARHPECDVEPDTTFFYVLLADRERGDPDGRVVGAVIESGFGCHHAGPDDGVDTTLRALVDRFHEMLQ